MYYSTNKRLDNWLLFIIKGIIEAKAPGRFYVEDHLNNVDRLFPMGRV